MKSVCFYPCFPLIGWCSLCSSYPPCIDFQNNRNANEKAAPFSWTFRSFQSLEKFLQTVCNETNGRLETLQRLNLTLYPCFYHPETPVPLHRPTSKHPPSNEIFFWKFFFWNLYRIFFEKNLFPLQEERHILSTKKNSLMMVSHYAFSSTMQYGIRRKIFVPAFTLDSIWSPCFIS